MNNKEAVRLLRKHLEHYRKRSYGELVKLIAQPQTEKLKGTDGTVYQAQVEVFWDSTPNAAIRVLGSIDDGGLRASAPLNEDFILAPNGLFIWKLNFRLDRLNLPATCALYTMLSAVALFILLLCIDASTTGPWERSYRYLFVGLPAIPLWLMASTAAPNLYNVLVEALPRGGGMVLFFVVGILGWGAFGYFGGAVLQRIAKR